ncbi:MAG: type II toxin-antitoxin system MqsR family toxin [Desulfuromonadales bacterium]|nr:type II toxin-antitoxin system MqsR family toxin [Desulfuromonadales bacterium]
MSPQEQYGVATHDLEYIKALLARGRYLVTVGAQKGAVGLGYTTEEDIIERILSVTPNQIYKTMPAHKAPPGTMQDVYHCPEGDGTEIYLKLQISPIGDSVVISFKAKEI